MRPRGLPYRMGPETNDGYGRAFSTDLVNDAVANNASQAEDVARLRTCAKCGTHNDFSQQRIWHESKADFEGSD